MKPETPYQLFPSERINTMLAVGASKNTLGSIAIGSDDLIEQLDGRLPFRIAVKRVDNEIVEPHFFQLRFDLTYRTDIRLGLTIGVKICGGSMKSRTHGLPSGIEEIHRIVRGAEACFGCSVLADPGKAFLETGPAIGRAAAITSAGRLFVANQQIARKPDTVQKQDQRNRGPRELRQELLKEIIATRGCYPMLSGGHAAK